MTLIIKPALGIQHVRLVPLAVVVFLALVMTAPALANIKLAVDFDKTPTPRSSWPRSLTEWNGNLFFLLQFSEGANSWEELWKHDGVHSTKVSDLGPSSGGWTSRVEILPYGGSLYFAGYGSAEGRELWKFDGATASLVEDIRPGSESSDPTDFFEYDGKLYFRSNTSSTAAALWMYDGNTLTIIRDFPNDGSEPSGPLFAFAYEDEVYFHGNSATTGQELFKLDGSSIALVDNIASGSQSSYPLGFTEFQGKVYFIAQPSGSSLFDYYVLDQTGVTRLLDGLPGVEPGFAASFSFVDDTLYFTTRDPSSGVLTIWSYDGSQFNVVIELSLPVFFFQSVGQIYQPSALRGSSQFYASVRTGISDHELWKFDGTDMVLVKDINPGERPSDPGEFTEFNSDLYFRANNGASGVELFRYDGNDVSLAFDGDPIVDTNDSNANSLKGDADIAFIEIHPPPTGAYSYYEFDGTVATLLPPTIPQPITAGPYLVGGEYIFAAEDPSVGLELWRRNGSTADLLADINPGAEGSDPKEFFVWNSVLYFSADDGTNGVELWQYDGTSVSMVYNVNAFPQQSSYPQSFVAYDGYLYFAAANTASTPDIVLNRYDGRTVSRMSQFAPGEFIATDVRELIEFDNKLFFVGNEGSREVLYSFDGTQVTVEDAGLVATQFKQLTVFDSKLFLVARGLQFGSELWSFDGHDMEIVSDLFPGTSSGLQPGDRTMMVFDSKLFFAGDDGVHGQELWSFDGTNLILEEDIRGGSIRSIPESFFTLGDRFFLTAIDNQHGREIFEFVPNQPPILQSIPDQTVDAGQTLSIHFFASDPDAGPEPRDIQLDQASLALGMSVGSTSGDFSWMPGVSDIGSHTVTVTLSDGEDAVNQSFTITVEAANVAPEVDPINDQEIDVGEILSFVVQADDPDDKPDPLDYSLDTASAQKGMILNVATGAFAWTPSIQQVGTHSVTITVSDGALETTQSFDISVIDPAPPVDPPRKSGGGGGGGCALNEPGSYGLSLLLGLFLLLLISRRKSLRRFNMV